MLKRITAAWKAFLNPELLDIKDPLTGALTPREFRRLATRVVNRAKKEKQPLSLMFIDSNGLKRVNDTQEHAAGNAFLKKLAEAIFASIRPFDVCARWHGDGGDEFILLLPDSGLDGTQKVAKRIHRIFPYFSWGATMLAGDGDNLEDMVKRAEQLMYSQKKGENKQ